MLMAARKHAVDLAQGLMGFVAAFAPSAIAFLKSKVGRVPLAGIATTCVGPAIDLVSCVSLHPLHGWVLAGFLVPVPSVNECLLSWERHL